MNFLFSINNDLLVSSDNEMKIFLSNIEGNKKIYIFREFESEILEIISREKTRDKTIAALKKEYKGDTIEQDFENFINKLMKRNLITVEECNEQ